jgi:hypothetical protein
VKVAEPVTVIFAHVVTIITVAQSLDSADACPPALAVTGEKLDM